MQHIALDITSSTNEYLRQHDTVGLVVVTARHQTAGRGQIGHTWEDEEGCNIICSYAFTPPSEIRPTAQFVISQAVALAVRDTVACYVKEDVEIKWPNDIYICNRKVCGMLIEAELMGKTINRVIAGIGINVNQRLFRSDAPNPVSIINCTGHETDLNAMQQRLNANVERRLSQLERGEYEALRNEYFMHLFRREGFHQYKDDNGCFMAELYAIESTGHLILKDKEGITRRYAFKEASIVL